MDMEFIVSYFSQAGHSGQYLETGASSTKQVPGHTGLILKVHILSGEFQKAPSVLNQMLWEGRSSGQVISLC